MYMWINLWEMLNTVIDWGFILFVRKTWWIIIDFEMVKMLGSGHLGGFHLLFKTEKWKI